MKHLVMCLQSKVSQAQRLKWVGMTTQKANRSFQEKRETINGIDLSFYDSGTEGPALVFLHAFPLSKDMWLEQLQFFSDKFRVIAPDLRGFGNSSRGELEFSIELFASDLLALINKLKLEKIILCGLSMGGYVALNAALRFPERISHLLLCSTHCAADTEEQKKIRKETITKIRHEGIENFAEKFSGQTLQHDIPGNREAVQKTIEKQSVKTLEMSIKAMSERAEVCHELSALKMPVLILEAGEDKVVSAALTELLYSKMPHAWLERLESTGHLSNLDSPAEFNSVIEKFLKIGLNLTSK